MKLFNQHGILWKSDFNVSLTCTFYKYTVDILHTTRGNVKRTMTDSVSALALLIIMIYHSPVGGVWENERIALWLTIA